MIRIEIDGTALDFDPQELPGFYYALQDLIDLSALKGSRSTTMRIPATAQVRAALGGWSMSEEADEAPLPFRVTTGGAVIFSGKAKVISRSADEYEVVAIGDNAAWKDGAASLRLREIPLGDSPAVNRPYQISTWYDEDSPVTFPLIDYGALSGRLNNYNVTPTMLRPALRVWSLLRNGFALLGYSIEAKRGLLATHKKFVLPCTVENVVSRTNDASNVMVMTTPCCGIPDCAGVAEDISYAYAINANGNSTPGFLGFDFTSGIVADYQSPGRYVASSDGFIAASMRARFAWRDADSSRAFTFVIYDTTTGDPVSTVSQTFAVGGNNNATADITFAFPPFEGVAGNEYAIAIHVDTPTDVSPPAGIGTPGSPCSDAIGGIGAGSILILEGTESRWLSTTVSYTEDLPLIINTAAPDITLLELLKWWTINQNITVRTDELTKHITFEYYDDFCRPITEGLDRTYRIDHTDPPRKVTDVLPKSYQFRFAEDANDAGVNAINKASGSTVPYGGYDHPVPTGQDNPVVVDIGFAPTAMAGILGGQLFVPIMRDESFSPDINGFIANQFKWSPRLLYMDGAANARWVYDGVDAFEYPRCYFIWPETGRNNLSFGNEASMGSVTAGTVATRWRNRLRRSTAPTLEAFIRLYDHELMGFDFGRPIYLNDGQHGSWFYIIEVKRHQFLADRTTEVKMVRV